jgi:hypothetical protein
MTSASTHGRLARIGVALGGMILAFAAAVVGIFGADRWARSERAARFSARVRELARGPLRPQAH